MIRSFRRLLLTTSGSLISAALLTSTAAVAQVTAPNASSDAVTQARDPVAQGDDDIIVTAQKREESLNKVPISITVLSGAILDSSTTEGVSEALRAVPGVTTTQYFQGGGTNVTIRGVSASAPVLNGSGPVSYYLDTVPFGFVKSAISPDSSAYDLQRVEVLRGPQGTLYGASALNGVVRVLTNDADLSRTDFKARASTSYTEAGSFNYRVDGMVNVPLVEDKLGVRLVAGYTNNDGWIDRPGKENANDSRMFTLRAKVNAAPTEDLSIGLSYWRARNNYGAPAVGNENYFRNSPTAEPLITNYDALGLKVGYDFGDFTVTNSASYLNLSNDGTFQYVNFFAGALDTEFKTKVFANELAVNSAGSGSLKWSVGGSYRSVRDELIQGITGLFDYYAVDKSKAFALFGEATQTIGELQITGGLRYFNDKVSAQGNGTPNPPARSTFSAVTPRAVLTWLPTNSFTAYLSYSQGFRSGAIQYQALVPASFPTLKPDRLNNYEAGVKAGLLDGLVQLDASLYYIDWNNVQQSLLVPVGAIVVTALVNGEGASGLGVDARIGVQPTPSLNLALTANWNDLRMDADVISGGVVLFDKGSRLNLSPKYTLGGSADYAFPVGSRKAHLSGSVNYTSAQTYRTISSGVRSISQGDDVIVAGARLAVDATDKLRVSLFVDNLTNANPSIFSFPLGGAINHDFDSRIRPRTFGIQLEYR